MIGLFRQGWAHTPGFFRYLSDTCYKTLEWHRMYAHVPNPDYEFSNRIQRSQRSKSKIYLKFELTHENGVCQKITGAQKNK